jgi:CheY-like chemotaxis protein
MGKQAQPLHILQKTYISHRRKTIQSRKILVVDDEFLIRWSLAQALSNEGYEVVAVENGRKAIDIASAQHFDFVITDLTMPELDGWKVLDTLVQFQFPPRVIVMTAHGEENNQKRVLEKGGWAYVEKSCLIDDIKETLKSSTTE